MWDFQAERDKVVVARFSGGQQANEITIRYMNGVNELVNLRQTARQGEPLVIRDFVELSEEDAFLSNWEMNGNNDMILSWVCGVSGENLLNPQNRLSGDFVQANLLNNASSNVHNTAFLPGDIVSLSSSITD